MSGTTPFELYDWQREAIDELTTGGGQVLVVAPTGGGKSICYQQPAVDLDGVALVITPLVSLMADQVASLKARGIPATYLASHLDAAENRRRADAALAGQVKLLYVAPERLASDRFVEEVLARLPLSLLAVDEAHCISHWGHDFRPDYLQLGALVQRLHPPRLLACTATATPAVRNEIVERLGMPQAKQILRGFARDNLELTAEEVSGGVAKEKRIALELKRVLKKPGAGNGTAIVYTGSRRNAESVAQELRGRGWRSEHYHAGMEGPDRTRVQDLFQRGDLDVIAATNAFGMGIDRPDIRLVVHHAITESVEAYYQEVGRAGRDGQPAKGLLLVSDPDIALRFSLLAKDAPSAQEQALHRRDLLRSMITYAETASCRHDHILHYFEDEAEELGGCGRCDNCRAAASGDMAPEPDEAASEAVVRDALSAIRGLPFAAGAQAITSYLIGHGSTQVRRYEWQSRDKFGVLKDRREDWVRRLLRRLVAGGLLAVGAERATLHVTRRGAGVIAGLAVNPVRLPPDRGIAPARPASAAGIAGLDGYGAGLFERLKEWRRLRADAEGVPAFAVCIDSALRAIADARPSTSEQLIELPGIGEAKLRKYGAQILAEVRAHAAAPPELQTAAPLPPPAPLPVMMTNDGKRRLSEYQIEVRKTYARAFESWTPEEDAAITALFHAGGDIEAICRAQERQPNSIRLRLEHLGLIEPQPREAAAAT